MSSTSENLNPQTQTKSQQTIVPVTSTGTIPPTFKAKKPNIKEKRKRPEAVASSTSKERSWVRVEARTENPTQSYLVRASVNFTLSK